MVAGTRESFQSNYLVLENLLRLNGSEIREKKKDKRNCNVSNVFARSNFFVKTLMSYPTFVRMTNLQDLIIENGLKKNL